MWVLSVQSEDKEEEGKGNKMPFSMCVCVCGGGGGQKWSVVYNAPSKSIFKQHSSAGAGAI